MDRENIEKPSDLDTVIGQAKSLPPTSSSRKPTQLSRSLVALAIGISWCFVISVPFINQQFKLPLSLMIGLFVIATTIAILVSFLALRYISLWRRYEIRNLALAELRFLKRQYEVAEEVVKLGSWIANLQTREILWTRGMYELFGFDIKQPIPEFNVFLSRIHPDEREMVRLARHQAAKEGQNFNLTYRFCHMDGRVLWIHSHGYCEKNRSGKVKRIQAVVRDVTETQLAFSNLQESEAKFRALANMGSDWYWETDIEHRFSWISVSATRRLGDFSKNALGKHRWDLDIFGVSEEAWQRHREILDAHLPFEDFYLSVATPRDGLAHVTISGQPIFDTRGNFQGYRGVGRDVTIERSKEILLQIENGLATAMHNGHTASETVTTFIRVVCEQMGWAGGSRWYRQHGGGTVARAESWGSARYMQYLLHPDDVIALESDTIQAEVWRTARPRWINNLAEQPGFTRNNLVRHLGFNAAIYIPITDRQIVIGVLVFLSAQNHEADQFIYQAAEVISRGVAQYLQRRRAEERLLFASTHDPLTELPNRAMLVDIIEKRLQKGGSLAEFGLFFIDLDRYKNINDTLGHEAGDDALIQMAKRLTKLLREEDVIARVGGDEFVVVIPGIAQDSAAEAIAHRILREIEIPLSWHDRTYNLSASIGVALAPRDGNAAYTLIKNADTAMYRVKSSGRNGIQIFNLDIQLEREDFLRLETELEKAIEQNRLQLYYQPIFSVSSGLIIGLEGLARWLHDEWGFVAPSRFIPVAEESNLIAKLGDWSIRRACLDHMELRALGLGDIAVSVNLSAKQLNDPALAEYIEQILEELEMPPHQLHLELTESAWMRDPDRAIYLMERIRRLGVELVIDDFGTGYSSLAYVKNLPVSTLKIDRAFIQGLPNNPGDKAIVEAIITLCERLNLDVVAEGIESPEQLTALKELSCHAAQGYYLGEPVPFDQLEKILKTQIATTNS